MLPPALRWTLFGATITSLLPLPFAHASSTRLDSEVVVGSRVATRISDIPGNAWIIDAEQLRAQFSAGVPLKEALAHLVPSLDIASQGRTNYGQNMRGRGVLVMIDGVSLNSSRNVSRQFDSIDPFNIERIEVLSGASAVYGGGATGGVINIVTKRGQIGGPRYELEAGVRSGFEASDDRDLRAGAAISGGNQHWVGRLALAGQDNGGAWDANGDQVIFDIAQTDMQYNRSIDLLGNLDLALTDGQSLSLNAQVYDSGYEGNKGLYFGPNLAALYPPYPEQVEIRRGLSSDLEPRTERLQLSADYRLSELLGHNVNLQAYHRREKLNFHPFPYVASGYFAASEQDTELSGLKAVFSRQQGAWRFNYGLDLEHESFEADQTLFDFSRAQASGGLDLAKFDKVGRYPGYEVDSLAAFAQAEWQLSQRWLATAGIRQQRYRVKVDDFIAAAEQVRVALGLASGADPVPGGKNRYNTTLVNLGAVFSIDQGQQLWGNLSQGYEVPDPGKYYGQGQYAYNGSHRELIAGVSVADQPLKAIKTNQAELGWRLYRGDLDAQLAAYYAWSDESLSYDRNTLAVQVNDEKKRNYGLEAQLNWRPTTHWQLGTSTHLTRAELRADGDWKKQNVTQASPSKVTAWGGWADDLTNVRLQGIHSLNLKDDDGNRIDGYTTWDLLVERQLPVGQLGFGIQNLLNKDYTSVWGQRAILFYSAYAPASTFDYRGRGRTWSLSYAVSF